MKLTQILLLFAFLWALPNSISGQKFADQMLLGANFGYAHDSEEPDGYRYETSLFWNARAGISLNHFLYGGVRAQIVTARNFATDWKNYYMAGLWVRGYFLKPVEKGSQKRWGFFGETGLLEGNYDYEYKSDVQYFVTKNGQWYLPFIAGAEYRLWKSLTVEGSFHGYFNLGKSWNLHGIGYLSLGLNWHL